MLGAPAEDMDRFKGWSNDIALIVEPFVTPAKVEGVRRATEALFAYVETSWRHGSASRWTISCTRRPAISPR